MTAPAWLDELDLDPGPPWLSMGTHGLAARPWLLPDGDRERDLAWKAELLATRHDEVFAALDTPAVHAASEETLALVVAAKGGTPEPGVHPLDAAGRLVQEDLCLLVLRDGAPHLDAASLCFPSYWRLADKLGRPMAEVHGPVAHYGEELATKVDAFLTRLRPDHPVWRRNWSIHDDPTYFLPGVGGTTTSPAHPDAPNPPDSGGSGHGDVAGTPPCPQPPDGLWLRSERQTLRRLTSEDAVLFTIRTQQVPLAALGERPDLAGRMAAAIEAWSRALRAYKGDHGALLAAPWLASR